MWIKIFSKDRFQSQTRTSLINIKHSKLSTCCGIKFLNRYMIVVPAFCIGALKVFDFSWGRATERIKIFRKSFPINVDCNPVHSWFGTRIQIKNVCRWKTYLFNMLNFIQSIYTLKVSTGYFII